MIALKPTLFILTILSVNPVRAQDYTVAWESIDRRPTPEWFANAKLGIFIHWGVYSVPAWAPTGENINTFDKYAEWYWNRINSEKRDTEKPVYNLFAEYHNDQWGQDFLYQDFAPLWKAEAFVPGEWARIIKTSGAKYVVLTSKHHDGFALWPSEHSGNWNSWDIGPHRDICGELSEAIKKSGLRMGLYYSLYEWFNPVYTRDTETYVDEQMLPQLKDIVYRYEPEIIWADGAWDHSSDVWKSTEFLAWLYNESPVRHSVVVNDRWGKETRGKHGDFFTTEYDHGPVEADDHVYHPWEECRGIGGSFGYNQNENLEDYQSSTELIQTLIEKVSAGGNLLLNIGPTASGRIPVIMQQRLKDLGDWLDINKEAIFYTRPWDKRHLNSTHKAYYFTSNKENIYLILTKWSAKPIHIFGIDKASGVHMLGLERQVEYEVDTGALTIYPPSVTPDEVPCNFAWVYKISCTE